MILPQANLAAFLTLEAKEIQPIKDISDLAKQGLTACVRDVDVDLIHNWFPKVKTVSFATEDGQVQGYNSGACVAIIVNGITLSKDIETNKVHCDKELVGTPLVPYYAGWVTNFESPCVMVTCLFV